MKYFYAGHQAVGYAIKARMDQAGHELVSEPGSAQVVVTCYSSQPEMEDAYLNSDGLIQVAQPRTLVIDMSPATPNFARELGAVAMVSDISFVEAPLILNDIMDVHAFSNKDNLTAAVAGEESDVERAAEILDVLVGKHTHVGGHGSAQLVRCSYILQMTAAVLSAIESQALFNAVKSSSWGINPAAARVSAIMPQAQAVLDAVADEEFHGAYTVEFLIADLSAALMAADDVDLILPQAESAQRLLEILAMIGGGTLAPSALALAYSDEETAREYGLDWNRAQQNYQPDDGCGCGHDHGHDDEFDFEDEYGFYSDN